jgi:hypothetical protein
VGDRAAAGYTASPGLYDSALLDAAGITHVINCCVSDSASEPASWAPFAATRRYRFLFSDDLRDKPTFVSQNPCPQWPACVEFLREAQAAGGAALVHCWAGKNRSATTAAVFMVLSGLATGVPEAVALIKAARPVIDAVVAQAVPVNGVEVWRASAMAAEAAMRDGDGARAEELFREPTPTPAEVALPLARLEAAAGRTSDALARLDAMGGADERQGTGDRHVVACEIAAFADTADAQARCVAALEATLGGRALWVEKDDGKNDRLLARVLVRFDGGLDAAMRALDRAYHTTRRTGGDVSFVVGQAIGAALVADKPDALGSWVDRALELDADDLVYFGAWADALLTRHAKPHETLVAALRHARARSPWVQTLADARQARSIKEAATLAKHDAERAEAAFYMGLEAWSRRDDSAAAAEFRRSKSYRALDLMEYGFSEGLLAGPAKLALPAGRSLP